MRGRSTAPIGIPNVLPGGSVAVRTRRPRSVHGTHATAADARELGDAGELALVPGGVTTGRFVLLVDPDLELGALDAPGTVLADADGGELSRTDEAVDRAHVDGEQLRGIGEGQESPELAARSR